MGPELEQTLKKRKGMLYARIRALGAKEAKLSQELNLVRERRAIWRQEYEQIDRQLAEVDGRARKVQAKLEPRRRNANRPMTKEELKQHLLSMTLSEREKFLKELGRV
jgi:hypothetical protein